MEKTQAQLQSKYKVRKAFLFSIQRLYLYGALYRSLYVCSVQCSVEYTLYNVIYQFTLSAGQIHFVGFLAHPLNLMTGLMYCNLSPVKMMLCSLHICKKWSQPVKRVVARFSHSQDVLDAVVQTACCCCN